MAGGSARCVGQRRRAEVGGWTRLETGLESFGFAYNMCLENGHHIAEFMEYL
ncbi:hypothetical protein CASFOL_028683 [Castilleja foliolosa]|uniref:Uncharacterized protein n=1 Tax=Castilleja foliolosa TaxID=1961234 RepID=A0ABD3CBW1_9LAMI